MANNFGTLFGSDPAGNAVIAPTVQVFSGTNYQTFTVSSSTVSAGAVYTNNTYTFTVVYSITSGASLVCSGTGAPTSSGTLTKFSGTGPATITFSAVSANGTYVLPSGPIPLYIKVRSVGAGGGGGGSTNGSAGGNTTFSTFVTCNGGAGGNLSAGAVTGAIGGTASVTTSSTVIQLVSLQGGSTTGSQNAVSTVDQGTPGAPSPFGGAGGGGAAGSGAGFSATGYGSGGGGIGGSGVTFGAIGGAAGGYAEIIISSPLSSYVFTVGAFGTGGTGGGNGGGGAIIVEEFYQ